MTFINAHVKALVRQTALREEAGRWRKYYNATTSIRRRRHHDDSNFRYTISSLLPLGAATIVMTQRSNHDHQATETTSCDGSASKKLATCGEWCSSAEEDTPCQMDTAKVPCLGKHCATTAGLWSLFILGPLSKNRPVSCQMYKVGVGYPIGACPCDPSCLIAEIKKERYPQPTGYGVFCKPGTCQPAASPRHAGSSAGLGTLSCPCNWFGSECTNDWMPIQRITKKRIGALDQITVTVENDMTWNKLVKDHRPGAVVRLNMRNGDAIHELACVVSNTSRRLRQLELLVAPTDSSLDPSVRYVADFLRSFEDGTIATTNSDSNIYINPAISGFYNAQYQFLKDYIKDDTKVRKVVILATGAGLGGVMSVLEGLRDDDDISIRLYYGLRDISCLPYSKELSEWVKSGRLEMILVESTRPAKRQDQTMSLQVREAAARGDILTKQLTRNKAYVQHAFEHDLATQNIHRADTVVVVCGRLQVIDDTHRILAQHGHDVGKRLFLNI